MVNFAYALPYVPPRPPISPWRGVELSWTGWDGSQWELTDHTTGLLLMPGIRGLGLPPWVRHSTESPYVPGSRHRGTSTKDREVFWPLFLFSDASSMEFLERDRAFWRSLDPDLTGTWTARLPDGTQRTLDLRLTSAEDDLAVDPIEKGWARYGVTLIADQPHWLGEVNENTWAMSDLRDYYVSADDRAQQGYAPNVIHYLSSGASLGEATVTNNGDVPSYPEWTAVGPFTNTTFGVGSSLVKVPFTVAAGYAVQIDTDPVNGQVLWYGTWDAKNKAIKNPVDRTKDLDPTSAFVAIPRGQDRPLTMTMTGTGQVLARTQNKYWRAW